MKFLLNLLVVFMPWRLKHFCLVHFYKYKIHPKAHIGLSYIFPAHLEMQEGAEIGHLNVAIHLELIYMERDCTISQRNWITNSNQNCHIPKKLDYRIPFTEQDTFSELS